jgi:hypothetical protein
MINGITAMRITLTLFSLLALSVVPVSAFAQSGPWSVQPAPQSWGGPQREPYVQQGATPAPQFAPPVQQGRARSLDDAVSCSAALQLATMAAPNWARERGVTDATNAWLQKVFELAGPRGVQGDQVPALVEAEMQRQVDAAATDPANLSRRAFDCASRQP